MSKPSEYTMEFLVRPGRRLSEGQLERLSSGLRSVAETCFQEVPRYQCLAGTREALSEVVICLAKRRDGAIAGFSSGVLLPVDGLGEVLHLGLTCVRPEDRGARLTHKLISRAVIQYLVTRKPLGKLWISNCACVLSSLGNVALNFEDVYPSPFGRTEPSLAHRRVARAVDAHYRDKIYIRPEARFDPDTFVFRGSVDGTMFQKRAEDESYWHRERALNDFYGSRMAFERGDEVLQVGYASVWAGLKYMLTGDKKKRALIQARPMPEMPQVAVG